MNKSREAFRTISEVSDWLETPAHVLRFWESKFSQIRPVKGAGGRRYYRPEDMALLGGIKFLLHEQGLTIKGAQKLLREQGLRYVAALGPQPFDDDSAPDVAPIAVVPVVPRAAAPQVAAPVQPPVVSPEVSPVVAPVAAPAAPPVAAPAMAPLAAEPAASTAPIMDSPMAAPLAERPVTAAPVSAAPVMQAPPLPIAPVSVPLAADPRESLAAESLPAPLEAAPVAPLTAASHSAAENHGAQPDESANPAATEGAEISQSAAETAPEPVAPRAAIPAKDAESVIKSGAPDGLTLRRAPHDILIRLMMVLPYAALPARESLVALALRLTNARSRISIE